MKVAVIIPAAGQSRRFGQGDKLAQDLGGRALLLRTVELFTKREEVGSIIVAGPPEDMEGFRNHFGAQLSFHGVRIVEGGRKERWETVRNALAAVPEDCTHIAVHDAARPATDSDLLDRVFEAAKVLDAVIPVVPLSFTVKRVGAETVEAAEVDPIAAKILGDSAPPAAKARLVEATVDRRGLGEAQTPQVFKAELLRRAYAKAKLDGATDDAEIVERIGEKVYSVLGDVRNIKVTTWGDLHVVRAILGVRAPSERPVHKRF